MLEGPNSRVRGTITADPLLELPVGSTLALAPVRFPPLSDGLHAVREWTHFSGALLQVGLKSRETFRITGSAIVVGPSVAVLAKHVIEGEIAGLMTGTLAAYFTSIAAHGLEFGNRIKSAWSTIPTWR